VKCNEQKSYLSINLYRFFGDFQAHVSISSTFLTAFSYKCVLRSFRSFFVHTGINFINVLGTPFSYESLFGSFSQVTIWLWQKYESTFVQKSARKMLMKLTTDWRRLPT